ncbi:MAG: hypothetical protein QM784_37230 [Polyangiaceae bacterium]
MADELGALSFVSWVRQGLASGIALEDGSSTSGTRTVASIELSFNDTSTTANAKVSVPLPLIGPGDIVGLDSDVIVRVTPKAEEMDAEYEQFVAIEFDQADLPWRYTPARAKVDVAAGTDQLRPWFTLVVVQSDEGSISPPSSARKTWVLSTSESYLPNPDELWAWAHTQFEGEEMDADAARERIQGEPGLFTARLMSPRVLTQNKEYIACLVPTFERGRLIGLGTLPDDNVDALKAAWGTGSGAIELPVYYHWRFKTGTAGSFEQLARLVEAAVVPPEVGRRDMEVADPGMSLPKAASGSLPVEGALQSVEAAQNPVEWTGPDKSTFVDALENLVNISRRDGSLVVAPSLYGCWVAAQAALGEARPTGTNPPWFAELNSDPRNRVGAALGTKVIQREQQALLASAWDQVGELDSVNEELRVSQLGRGIGLRILDRHIRNTTLQDLYLLTVRLHTRLLCGDNTVCENFASSAVVPGFLSGQWRRLARPRGHIGQRQGRRLLTATPNLLARLNDGHVPAPEPSTPTGIFNPFGPLVVAGITCEQMTVLRGLGSEVLTYWGLLILWVARRHLVTAQGDCWWIALKALRYAIGLLQVAISGSDAERRCRWRKFELTVADVMSAPAMPEFVGAGTVPNPIPIPPTPGAPGTLDSADAAALREALVNLLSDIEAPSALSHPGPIDLAACATQIRAQLSPELVLAASVSERIKLDPSVIWNPTDPLEPILLGPQFEQPMYKPLQAVSKDWILPGLNQVKRNSAGLVVTNQRFVEAYMAGLNHEMARELLWNEFPTDQRQTYFQQFWEVAGNLFETGSELSPAQLKDIRPLRNWNKDAALGKNSPRPPVTGTTNSQHLVLVIRAQLIQRYPNVVVYAQQAENTAEGLQLTGPEKHPLFYGLLEPDVAFYGFDLTADMVNTDPSWFFVLQEQPGEPKFADDTISSRDTQTFSSPSQLNSGSSAAVAFATFQQPFRLGIQGTRMLKSA